MARKKKQEVVLEVEDTEVVIDETQEKQENIIVEPDDERVVIGNKCNKVEMFVPTQLPVMYCKLMPKFINVDESVSIGNYNIGSQKVYSLDEIDKIEDNSLSTIHCYNVLSDSKDAELIFSKIANKLKSGGQCIMCDESIDIRPFINKHNELAYRFCGRAHDMFNHEYWYRHKTISLCLFGKVK